MKRRTLCSILASACLVLGLTGCSGDVESPPDREVPPSREETSGESSFATPTVNSAIEYNATLIAVGDSETTGTAVVRVDGDTIAVSVTAEPVEPGGSYLLQMHGFSDLRYLSLSATGDAAAGIEAVVGPALRELFTGRAGEDCVFSERASLGDARPLYPLDVRALVLVTAGSREPVAVGLLEPAEFGDQGVGGPGSAGSLGGGGVSAPSGDPGAIGGGSQQGDTGPSDQGGTGP